MTRFIPTHRGNPCQLCNDVTGKCRETATTLLCMTFSEAMATIPGFKFIGRTKDNLWGKWILDDGQDWSESQREQWRRTQQQLKEHRAHEEAQRHVDSLAPEERDRYYRRLLKQLSLHPDDRKDLYRRGLTDAQIQAVGFKSVEQWQSLEQSYPHTLPGVNLDGRSLNVSGAGYLCPLRDAAGLLVGFQLRLRDSSEGSRYRWLSSATKKRPKGPRPHLPNGELPLAVHRSLDPVKRQAIALVEGTGTKPFLLAQKQGQMTIGAAGGQFASSPQTLEETLAVLSTALGTQVVEFYPDAGALTNPQVMRQYRATWKRLRQWGYSIRIAWWGQETKDSPDIDELTDTSTIQWLTIAQFEAIAHPRWDWLGQIQRRLQQAFKPTKSAAALRQVLDEPTDCNVTYPDGDRLLTWKQARQQGYRYVLDQSATGTGKSFDAGNVEPADLQTEQLIYVSDQHRNPTVDTLTAASGWVDLEARHAGLVRQATPAGGTRLKRANSGETPSVAANCNRTRVLGALRAKQIDGADTATLICGTCPLRETCTHAEGPGYGFLHQRRAALASSKLRSHPDSLPSPEDYDYDLATLIWDEPGQSLTVKRDIQVTLTDLEQTLTALLPYPLLFESVQQLFTTLLPYLNGKQKLKRFGLNHGEVLQLLPLPELNLAALEHALQPDLSFLNTTAKHGVELSDLPALLRKRFSERDSEMAEQAKQRLLKQWLPDLLRILTGQLRGNVRLESGHLTLSLAETRHREIAQAPKIVIFLDATMNRQMLALKLQCQPEDIFVCRQQVPNHNNLTVTQVHDLGRLGMDRGQEQQRRVAAIVKHYQALDPETKVIDFKRFTQEDMGAWWRDSRGVNDFTTTKRLILIGTPCRNLADLMADYAILTGIHDPEDAGFNQFVDQVILGELKQAIGRLRAHRRPGETLEVILLNDFALDVTTRSVKASDVTLEAAGKKERLLLAGKLAAEQLQARGEKVTQSAIAALTGYSQQRLSQIWKLLLLLLETPNSKSSETVSPMAKPLETEMASRVGQVITLLVQECDELQLLESIQQAFFEWLQPWQRGMVWQLLPIEAQIRICAALLLTLPTVDCMG